MNILFLTLVDFQTIDERGIYQDLLREFHKNGHSVYVISPVERKKNQETKLLNTDKATILKLKIGNIQKTNIIEKGISTVRIEPQFISAIKKYFSDVKFDLVLYSTPPITFCNAIDFVKKRDGARTYLLLKDIFPQNAVDMGMMSKTGIKSAIYKYFRNKENRLYAISDRIGCMSEANAKYVIDHNPSVDKTKVEVCPNSIEPINKSIDKKTRDIIRSAYSIPLDKKAFIYGGNLGKPQGIDFLIKCLKTQANNNTHFVIVGSGTDYTKIENYISDYKQENITLIKQLPRDEYDTLVGACDVGMVFLDCKFTIPNFPSRILSYMQAQIPVLNVTDRNTDIGKISVDGNFGWWCESNDEKAFSKQIDKILQSDLKQMGENGYRYLLDNYDVSQSYQTICNGLDLIR